MSSNPYQPPESGSSPSRFVIRDLGPVTLWTTILFSLEAVFLLLMGLAEVSLGQRGATDGASADAMLSGAEVLFSLSAIGWFLVWIPGIVSFCVWVRRANINADALVGNRMEFTPGWAVGWFFVPFANLFKPYQVMSEIYRASDPEVDPDYWTLAEVPRHLTLWWLSYLAFSIASNATSGPLRARAETQIGGWPQAIASFLGVASAVLAVVVIRSIRRLQEDKGRRMPRIARSIEGTAGPK